MYIGTSIRFNSQYLSIGKIPRYDPPRFSPLIPPHFRFRSVWFSYLLPSLPLHLPLIPPLRPQGACAWACA